MKKIGYIYKVTNIITNEAYIGQTNNYKERQRSHKRMEGNCWKFYDAITQYGLDNFKWEILEECLITELDDKEKHYIKLYDTKNCGYNLTNGGSNIKGYDGKGENFWLNRLPPEEKEAWIEKHRKGKNNGMYGKGDLVSGKNHFLNKMTPEKREKWIADNIAGEHNYQKSLTEEELKEKCWYNHRTEEEKEVYKDKFRGKNNPFKKAFLKNPEKYSGVNHPSYGRTGKKNLLSKKYIITLPNNEEYLVIGLKEFCRSYTEIKLLPCHFSECANGNKDTYKGFKCRHFDPTKDKNIKEWLTTDKKDANIQI